MDGSMLLWGACGFRGPFQSEESYPNPGKVKECTSLTVFLSGYSIHTLRHVDNHPDEYMDESYNSLGVKIPLTNLTRKRLSSFGILISLSGFPTASNSVDNVCLLLLRYFFLPIEIPPPPEIKTHPHLPWMLGRMIHFLLKWFLFRGDASASGRIPRCEFPRRWRLMVFWVDLNRRFKIAWSIRAFSRETWHSLSIWLRVVLVKWEQLSWQHFADDSKESQKISEVVL